MVRRTTTVRRHTRRIDGRRTTVRKHKRNVGGLLSNLGFSETSAFDAKKGQLMELRKLYSEGAYKYITDKDLTERDADKWIARAKYDDARQRMKSEIVQKIIV